MLFCVIADSLMAVLDPTVLSSRLGPHRTWDQTGEPTEVTVRD